MNGHVNGHASNSPEIFVQMVSSFSAHTNDVLSVAWTGNVVASASADKTIRVWNIKNQPGEVSLVECNFSPLKDHTFHVQSLHFSCFGNYLTDCSSDGVVMVWDTVGSGKRVASANYSDTDHNGPQHQTALRCCRMSLDAKFVAAGGDSDSVAVWSFDKIQGMQLLKVFYGHENTVTCICFTHDSAHVISGSISGDIRIWDCKNLKDQAVAISRDCHDLGVTCMDLANYKISTSAGDSAYQLATGGYDNLIKLWHVVDRPNYSQPKIFLSSTLHGHSADICSVKFANQNKMLISCSSDRTMILWDPIKCSALKRVGPLTKYARSCCFSSDDHFIMAGFSGGIIGFWHIFTERDQLPNISISVVRRSNIPEAQYNFLEDASAPDEFFCPITQELMKDPVVANDGNSYEREAITTWFKSHETSPKTNLILSSQVVIPNINLKQLIEKWKENREKNSTTQTG